jgi:hypothetical protein
MPEEGLETQELKEKLEEAAEHALHEAAPWLTWLSLSTAILAVLAAIASLESGSFANDAIVQKNDAVLHQSKADDEWAHYQAAGVKAVVYATQAEATEKADVAAKWRSESERERGAQRDIKEAAQKEQEQVEAMDRASEHSLHVHHRFAQSVTVFQVAIAVAAIAALTRRKAMWWVSLVAGAAGAALFASGLLAG